jgi:hypothetical protein
LEIHVKQLGFAKVLVEILLQGIHKYSFQNDSIEWGNVSSPTRRFNLNVASSGGKGLAGPLRTLSTPIFCFSCVVFRKKNNHVVRTQLEERGEHRWRRLNR